MSTASILVTGSNGFLGSEIVRQARSAGHIVRATGQESNCFLADIEYVQADITQPDQLTPTVAGVSAVIHTAGLAHVFSHASGLDERFRQINEEGTANMAQAAAMAGVTHFILISSVSVYGPFTHQVCAESSPCNPLGPYAHSKRNAEKRVQAIGEQSGMAVTVLRLATLYGEGDPGNVGRLMRSIDSGRFIWIGDGSNRKSLLYRGDAARACLAVVEAPATGFAIYNVSAPPATMRETVDGLADALGKKPLPIRISATVAISAARILSRFSANRFSHLQATIEKWLADDVYDATLIERVIGFRTQISLAEGLRREVEWYRSQPSR